ncbi:MAG: hypothetical protein M1481_07140 [Candidatus Thermoplasmatota archaeon]|nr:hypothetical protein [Candidatus Thermoplasmatota archaeon]MCL5963907.1 hypothetical protein [Candidatus Thermoplasmatota archaeon]
MNLNLRRYYNQPIRYESLSQHVRAITEQWAKDNLYCPHCGRGLKQYKAGTPIYDFYCTHPNGSLVVLPIENFQLKSSQKYPFINKILGGDYKTTVASLKSHTHPSLILLGYERKRWKVENVDLVHKLSITLSCIEPRKKLSKTAVRHGWQGCNIVLDKIPAISFIEVVKDSNIIDKCTVMRRWKHLTNILSGNLAERGWLADMIKCIENLPGTFSLIDVYAYETKLASLHPKNKHVKDKIRQQLQKLRDRGVIKFIGNGEYKKIV